MTYKYKMFLIGLITVILTPILIYVFFIINNPTKLLLFCVNIFFIFIFSDMVKVTYENKEISWFIFSVGFMTYNILIIIGIFIGVLK